jgi:hypothetical protein
MEYKEVDHQSKCTVTDAARDSPQNSSEQPTSKPIEITGSPETYST